MPHGVMHLHAHRASQPARQSASVPVSQRRQVATPRSMQHMDYNKQQQYAVAAAGPIDAVVIIRLSKGVTVTGPVTGHSLRVPAIAPAIAPAAQAVLLPANVEVGCTTCSNELLTWLVSRPGILLKACVQAPGPPELDRHGESAWL